MKSKEMNERSETQEIHLYWMKNIFYLKNRRIIIYRIRKEEGRKTEEGRKWWRKNFPKGTLTLFQENSTWKRRRFYWKKEANRLIERRGWNIYSKGRKWQVFSSIEEKVTNCQINYLEVLL